MSDLLEEEVWRLPQTAKSRDVRTGTPCSFSLSPAAKARLRRIVNKVPEAMVKLTGRTRGAHGHLKAHFDYLTRHGRRPCRICRGQLGAGNIQRHA
jgi:hypothetical protein